MPATLFGIRSRAGRYFRVRVGSERDGAMLYIVTMSLRASSARGHHAWSGRINSPPSTGRRARREASAMVSVTTRSGQRSLPP